MAACQAVTLAGTLSQGGDKQLSASSGDETLDGQGEEREWGCFHRNLESGLGLGSIWEEPREGRRVRCLWDTTERPGARLPSPQRALPKPRLLLSRIAPLPPLTSPAQGGVRDPGSQEGEGTIWRLAGGRGPAEGPASTWGQELFFCPTRGLLKAWAGWARGCRGFSHVLGAVVEQRKGSFGQAGAS